MLTYEQAWKDQDDLDALINGRYSIGESFPGNAFYGNAATLRTYANGSGQIQYAIQHGVTLHNWVWHPEINGSEPIYCWQKSRLEVYKHHTAKRIYYGAAPFLYALALVQNGHERRGTLFFPAHSTEAVGVSMDYQKIITWLLSLPNEYQPVDVCIFWKDYKAGRHEPFEFAGMRIVSAGNMYDPQFNFRLAHLLSRYKYTSSNDVGSQLFYSVAAGCDYFQAPFWFKFHGGNQNALNDCINSKPAQHIDKWKKMFAYPPHDQTDYHELIMDEYLGRGNMLEPDRLRAELCLT